MLLLLLLPLLLLPPAASVAGKHLVIANDAVQPGSRYTVACGVLRHGVGITTAMAAVRTVRAAKQFQKLIANDKWQLRKHQRLTDSVLLKLQIPQGKFDPNGDYQLLVTVTDTTGATYRRRAKVRLTAPAALTFVQSDKSIYRCGESARFRAVVLNSNLLPAARVAVKFVVKDSKRQEILRTSSRTNGAGVAEFQLSIGNSASIGKWTVAAAAAGGITSRRSAAIRKFWVAPRNSPKFPVRLRLPRLALTTDAKLRIGGEILPNFGLKLPRLGVTVVGQLRLRSNKFCRRFGRHRRGKRGCRLSKLKAAAVLRSGGKFELKFSTKSWTRWLRKLPGATVAVDVAVLNKQKKKISKAAGKFRIYRYKYKLMVHLARSTSAVLGRPITVMVSVRQANGAKVPPAVAAKLKVAAHLQFSVRGKLHSTKPTQIVQLPTVLRLVLPATADFTAPKVVVLPVSSKFAPVARVPVQPLVSGGREFVSPSVRLQQGVVVLRIAKSRGIKKMFLATMYKRQLVKFASVHSEAKFLKIAKIHKNFAGLSFILFGVTAGQREVVADWDELLVNVKTDRLKLLVKKMKINKKINKVATLIQVRTAPHASVYLSAITTNNNNNNNNNNFITGHADAAQPVTQKEVKRQLKWAVYSNGWNKLRSVNTIAQNHNLILITDAYVAKDVKLSTCSRKKFARHRLGRGRGIFDSNWEIERQKSASWMVKSANTAGIANFLIWHSAAVRVSAWATARRSAVMTSFHQLLVAPPARVSLELIGPERVIVGETILFRAILHNFARSPVDVRVILAKHKSVLSMATPGQHSGAGKLGNFVRLRLGPGGRAVAKFKLTPKMLGLTNLQLLLATKFATNRHTHRLQVVPVGGFERRARSTLLLMSHQAKVQAILPIECANLHNRANFYHKSPTLSITGHLLSRVLAKIDKFGGRPISSCQQASTQLWAAGTLWRQLSSVERRRWQQKLSRIAQSAYQRYLRSCRAATSPKEAALGLCGLVAAGAVMKVHPALLKTRQLPARLPEPPVELGFVCWRFLELYLISRDASLRRSAHQLVLRCQTKLEKLLADNLEVFEAKELAIAAKFLWKCRRAKIWRHQLESALSTVWTALKSLATTVEGARHWETEDGPSVQATADALTASVLADGAEASLPTLRWLVDAQNADAAFDTAMSTVAAIEGFVEFNAALGRRQTATEARVSVGKVNIAIRPTDRLKIRRFKLQFENQMLKLRAAGSGVAMATIVCRTAPLRLPTAPENSWIPAIGALLRIRSAARGRSGPGVEICIQADFKLINQFIISVRHPTGCQPTARTSTIAHRSNAHHLWDVRCDPIECNFFVRLTNPKLCIKVKWQIKFPVLNYKPIAVTLRKYSQRDVQYTMLYHVLQLDKAKQRH